MVLFERGKPVMRSMSFQAGFSLHAKDNIVVKRLAMAHMYCVSGALLTLYFNVFPVGVCFRVTAFCVVGTPFTSLYWDAKL